MDTDLRAIVAALGEQHDELASLLAALDTDGWRRPTRCEGWTVADVVLHLAQTDELALASTDGTFTEAADRLLGGSLAAATLEASVDGAVEQMVSRERGAPVAELHQRWLSGAAKLRDALLHTDVHQRLRWVTGELSTRTLTVTRLAECWIHSGDVAEAIGVGLTPADRLWHIVRLAWRTLPYAFARAGKALTGPVAFDLTGPSGDRWSFTPDAPTVTVVRGSAAELCAIAGRRASPDSLAVTAEGPDGAAVLDLVRTYA